MDAEDLKVGADADLKVDVDLKVDADEVDADVGKCCPFPGSPC